jgi:hypothetical protein
MNIVRFNQLTRRQQATLLIAMQIRNSMEDFHVKHLTDLQMKELNPIIRQAVYQALGLILGPTPEQREGSDQSIAYLVAMIPDYWEIPTGASSPEI